MKNNVSKKKATVWMWDKSLRLTLRTQEEHTPSHSALVTGCTCLICLAFNTCEIDQHQAKCSEHKPTNQIRKGKWKSSSLAGNNKDNVTESSFLVEWKFEFKVLTQIHNVVATDSTIVNHNICKKVICKYQKTTYQNWKIFPWFETSTARQRWSLLQQM
jgi:hypothetical protein